MANAASKDVDREESIELTLGKDEGNNEKQEEPQRVGEQPIPAKTSLVFETIAECPRCEAKGKLRLTGGSAKAPLILKCGNCSLSKEKREAEKCGPPIAARSVWKEEQPTCGRKGHNREEIPTG